MLGRGIKTGPTGVVLMSLLPTEVFVRFASIITVKCFDSLTCPGFLGQVFLLVISYFYREMKDSRDGVFCFIYKKTQPEG